ncbi:MAG: glycosyltransferase [Patescibacteria group bacterium]|nr:glycosyltransferase [Patescibacteria group bacterium]
MKVALIHDHLAQDGGAEKVLKVLAEMFPEAPIYTLLYEPSNAAKYFKNRIINTSIIQRTPFGVSHYKWFMPFMPMAVEFFNLSQYDLVISDTSSFAKGVITSQKTPHLCYCHTPTRYLWSDTHSYVDELKYNKYIKKIIGLSLNNLRVWDRAAADRVDFFVANSKFIAKRIKKYYRRESDIIYPPVEVDRFNVVENKEDYYLAGGRLVPYKRFDLLISAFKKTGRNLKIFGDGPDYDRLVQLAGAADNIEFLGRVSDEAKARIYGNAKAFLNPQEEDFGITMVEAHACGTPVIALASGGALEIVVDQETGLFFENQTVDAVNKTVDIFEKQVFDVHKIRARAEEFSIESFKEKMTKKITQVLEEYKNW